RGKRALILRRTLGEGRAFVRCAFAGRREGRVLHVRQRLFGEPAGTQRAIGVVQQVQALLLGDQQEFGVVQQQHVVSAQLLVRQGAERRFQVVHALVQTL